MLLRIWKFIQNRFFDKSAKRYVSSALMPGMKVWECNLITGDVVEADIIEVVRENYFVGTTTTKEVNMKPKCMYEVAINGQNAVRKFEKRIVELSKNKKL